MSKWGSFGGVYTFEDRYRAID